MSTTNRNTTTPSTNHRSGPVRGPVPSVPVLPDDEDLPALGGWGWTRWAACRDHPGIDWDEPVGHELARARRVCGGCPVRAQCLETGVTRAEPSGIWGGTTVDERHLLRRLGAPRPLPPHGDERRYFLACGCPECKQAHANAERERRTKRRQRLREERNTLAADAGSPGDTRAGPRVG